MKLLSDRIHNYIHSFPATIKKAIIPTIVATLIFLMTWRFFGMENTMIGPFATLSFLRYRSMHNHYECMIKNFAIYIIMAVLTYFAVMNLPLCILINAIALFWIAHILIDEYNPTNYFPAGMALIFFQIAPVTTLIGLGTRIFALLATFVLILLFVLILSIFEKHKDPLADYIRHGFDLCEQRLALYEQSDSDVNEKAAYLHNELHHVNNQISGEIYSFNRATLRRWDKTNFYCHFILVFQVFNYLTLHFDREDNLTKARTLYSEYKREFETVSPSNQFHRLNFRIKKPDIRSFRMRFALRQVITVTPCMVFAWASHLPNAYWLVISVFFMMIPFTDHTLQRVRQRVSGTVSGILICLVLFSIFRGFAARVVIMTIANFLIYGANGYGPTVAYITCSALAIQTIDAAIPFVLAQRLIYTLIGAAIALIANRFIFPIRIRYQSMYLVELLRNIRHELTDLADHTVPGDARRRKELDQRIIKTYLLFRRLESLYPTVSMETNDTTDTFDYSAFAHEHMSFIADFMSKYLLRSHS